MSGTASNGVDGGAAQGKAPITAQPEPGSADTPSNQMPLSAPPGEWMNMHTATTYCPRGLEYLTTVDQILVQQKLKSTCWKRYSTFNFKNALGGNIYYAAENDEYECCMFDIKLKVFDNFGNEVMEMCQPFKGCSRRRLLVSSPPGCLIGTIEHELAFCANSFRVKNHLGEIVLRIEGPFCPCSMCGEDVEFNIVTISGEEIGKIAKNWSGLAQEMFTTNDFFGITFPMNLDVSLKAVLLGATVLIDEIYFSRQRS